MGGSRTFYSLPPELHKELGFVEYLGIVVLGGFGIFLMYHCVVSTFEQEWWRTAFFLFGSLVMIGSPFWIAVSYTGRRRIHVDHATILGGDGSLVVPTARGYVPAVLLSIGCAGPAGILLSVGTWTNTLDLPLSPGQRAIFPPVLFIVALVSFGHTFFYTMWRRAQVLEVSPSQIVLPVAVPLSWKVRWVDLKTVQMGPSQLGNAVIRLEVRQPGGQPVKKRNIYAERFSIGAAATYHLLRFYHDHPQLRDELADHRAVDRIRSYRLMDSDEPDSKVSGSR